MRLARQNGHQDDDPFLVTSKPKQPPTKAAMVKAFRRVALALGHSEEEAQLGHVLRPMGAQFMARLGIDSTRFRCSVDGEARAF